MNRYSSLFVAACSLLAAASHASGGAETTSSLATPAPTAAPASRVILIGVDGLGARWIPWDKMPNLRALRDEGVYTVARCHRITASAINWKSVFSGLPPEIHGFNVWNSKAPGIEPPPSAFDETGVMPDLFSEISRQRPDARTVSLYTWAGLGFCHATNSASVVRYFGGEASSYPSRDVAVFDEGLRQLVNQPPLFMLLYNGEVDVAGHDNGWGSPEYTNACAAVDCNIGRLVDGIKARNLWDDTAIVFVADHGGLDKGHGGKEDVRVLEVPFLVSGGVARGMRLREPAMLMDVTPTILTLLGLEPSPIMRGRNAAY